MSEPKPASEMWQGGTLLLYYYIANEGISVVENAGLMGLPVPGVIKRALEQMREKHGSDTGE